MYEPKLVLYTNMKLYGLLLWKGKCIHLCGVNIAYQQLSDWTRLQWALHN